MENANFAEPRRNGVKAKAPERIGGFQEGRSRDGYLCAAKASAIETVDDRAGNLRCNRTGRLRAHRPGRDEKSEQCDYQA